MAAHAAQFEVRTGASDDLSLVHASKNGDVAAFEQLVKRYDRKLLRIAQSITRNREDSQDAVQEAFLKAYQNLAEFREDSQFPSEVTDWAPNPEQLYSTSELRDILIKIMEQLRPILRTVFVLRDIEGLSIHQTAEVLNQSHAAVKARLWRARLQLREALNKYFTKQRESASAESSSLTHAVAQAVAHSDSLLAHSHRSQRGISSPRSSAAF